MIRWLGLDSSLTKFGWAALECQGLGDKPRLLDAGLLRTEKDHGAESKTVDTTRRVHDIGLELLGLIARFSPMLLGIESLALPFGRTGMVTTSTLGRVRGLVDGIALTHGLRVVEIQPRALKLFATGDQDAEKEAVVASMCARHPALVFILGSYSRTKSNYEVGDIADAAAVASWSFGHVVGALGSGAAA